MAFVRALAGEKAPNIGLRVTYTFAGPDYPLGKLGRCLGLRSYVGLRKYRHIPFVFIILHNQFIGMLIKININKNMQN